MKRAILLLVSITITAFAEMILNPDSNTLWLETGKNMQFGDHIYSGKWFSSKLKFTEAEDGFIVEPVDGKPAGDGICAPYSKDYPYMEYELEVLEEKPSAMMFFPNVINLAPTYMQQNGIHSGYYVVNIMENSKLKGNGKAAMGLRVENAKVKIKNLRVVKEPKYKFSAIYRLQEYSKPLPTSAVVEVSLSSTAQQMPESAVVSIIDAVKNQSTSINGKRRIHLSKESLHPGSLCNNVEIVELGERNMDAGTLMLRAEGMEKPVHTWLPYTWKQPALVVAKDALPNTYDWINDIRTEHPRIFINKETLPLVREWAKEIDCSQILSDADTVEIDVNKREKRTGYTGEAKPYKQCDVEVLVPFEPEATTCAVAYLLTGEQKYADKSFRILQHCLKAYQDCAAKRTSINWYGIKRITAIAAMDWIYNAIPEADRKKWIKEFTEVNLKYARHGWYGPFYGINGGIGTTTGFYGDANTELYMGALAYKEGICDELAVDMLKQGYDNHRRCMNYRDSVAEDDGILSSVAMGYSSGQYPWVSYDFLAFWRTLFNKQVVLPKFNHLMYYAEWFQWNVLPGKGRYNFREFGLGDNAHTDMGMWGVSGHLYYILALYARDYPAEAAQIAAAIERMDGKYNVNYYKAREAVKPRKQCPPYYETFFRNLLAYDIKRMPKPAAQNVDHAMARHFPSGGVLFMRGTEPDVKERSYALFNVGSRLVAHKSRGDENHFTIFRKGYLAIDSGYRYDQWSIQCKYHHASVAHNTMLIHDPDERFDNDAQNLAKSIPHFARCWEKSPEVPGLLEKMKPYFADAQGGQNRQLGGKCRAFSTCQDYSYIVGDATPVYSEKKCEEFTRQFIHLQPDVFVIFDRVESVKPEFKKEWLLHFLEEPNVAGNVTTAHVTDEGGSIRCTTLLPKNFTIEKIGGPGKEFWGTNVNWAAPDLVMKALNYGGKWRIALSPKTPAARDYFLNVIEVGDAPLKALSSSEDDKQVTLNLIMANGRKIAISFLKNGTAGGTITIDGNTQKLTQTVQPQSGFLF